tara:strand:+ start:14816 stop:15850 length:1035 start_codon:yes stop_codon:yes gene_type:complete
MGVSCENSQDLYSDKIFSACSDCGCVQIKNLIPLDLLYAKSHNAAIGKTWDKHHLEFCKFTKEYVHGNVLEIGGGNLKVANNLSESDRVKTITIFDKNFVADKKSKKIILKNHFFDQSKIEIIPDVIIHTHLIEHLYNPLEDIKKISETLKEGGYMMFAAPIIDKMLKHNFTNAMNFEHTYMLSEDMIQNIMSYSNLEIVSINPFSEYINFYIAKKTINKKIIEHDYSEQASIIRKFCSFHESEVERIANQLDSEKENNFIFGAHIFTQYLLGFGLQQSMFANVLDNDPSKQKNRLYGTSLLVESPQILKNIKSPVVVLKAAMYTEEIKNDIIKNINSKTRFIL